MIFDHDVSNFTSISITGTNLLISGNLILNWTIYFWNSVPYNTTICCVPSQTPVYTISNIVPTTGVINQVNPSFNLPGGITFNNGTYFLTIVPTMNGTGIFGSTK